MPLTVKKKHADGGTWGSCSAFTVAGTRAVMVAASAASTSTAMAIGLFMKKLLTCDVTYISFFSILYRNTDPWTGLKPPQIMLERQRHRITRKGRNSRILGDP